MGPKGGCIYQRTRYIVGRVRVRDAPRIVPYASDAGRRTLGGTSLYACVQRRLAEIDPRRNENGDSSIRITVGRWLAIFLFPPLVGPGWLRCVGRFCFSNFSVTAQNTDCSRFGGCKVAAIGEEKR